MAGLFDFAEDRIGQWTRLSETTESELMGSFHYKTRNAVRKGYKGGFSVDQGGSDAAWEFLIATHTENMVSMGALPRP